MLAAIFSSYGNRTRLDRFIPVSTALLKKKQLDGMHACIHASAFVDRRCRIRSTTALRFFPALSCLLSSWSSLLTVALCFLQSRCFSRQWAKLFKKVCLFLGVGGGLADRRVLSMALAFNEHSLWSIHKGYSSCVDWSKALLSLTLFKMNETEKKIELERKESLSEWVPDEWQLADVGERDRSPRQTDRKRGHPEKGGVGIKGYRCTRKDF